MNIKVTFNNVKHDGDGLWKVQLQEEEVLSLAPAGVRRASHGVFLLRGVHFKPTTKTLEVPIGGVDVIVVGESGSTILINSESPSNFLKQFLPKNSEKLQKGTGLRGFVDSCRTHGLPEALVRSADNLLNELKKEIEFKLTEGEQRKWTADPNFIALTIQNRNKQLLVSVKGDPSKMGNLTISPKISRPPYCEFHFNSPKQYGDILSVALSSANY